MEDKKDFIKNIAEAPCSKWSGGCTCELAIGPDGTSYAARDFAWRVSSAVVELEESVFTDLPDYERWILTLDGDMELVHGEGSPVRLSPFVPHRFDGAECTRSAGKVRDFNLMLRKGVCRGGLRVFAVAGGGTFTAVPPQDGGGDSRRQLLFCADGSCTVESGGLRGACGKGDYLLVNGNAAVFNDGDAAVMLIIADICCVK